MICLVEDVTERFRLQSRLRFHADHDPLTGLATRAVLADRLQLALDEPGRRPVGICAIDLDGFRGVNDTLGHEIGDELLRAVAGRLRRRPRRGRAPRGPRGRRRVRRARRRRRHGSDARARSPGACWPPSRSRSSSPGTAWSVTATVGMVPGDGRGLPDAGGLMQAADTTLNRAKAARPRRRGRVRRRGCTGAAVSRFALAARMADALAAGEFALEYQPLVRLADGVTRGVEALVRWNLPTGGADRRRTVSSRSPRRPGTSSAGPVGAHAGVPAGEGLVRGPRPTTRCCCRVNLAARQIRDPGIVADIARDARPRPGGPQRACRSS